MKIIALIGKTSSGKDTIAKYMKTKYGIDAVVSYTTRKMRENETNGVEHHFISEDEMDALTKDMSKLLAYTRFPKTGIRYCATETDFIGKESIVYIINPDGIDWLTKNRPDIDLIQIYVDLDEKIIKQRAKSRKDKSDDVKKRLDSERKQFDDYKQSGSYDYLVSTDCPMDEVELKIDAIMSEVL